MKWVVLLAIVVFLFVFARTYLQEIDADPEQKNEATTVHVDVDVEIDEHWQNRVDVSWTTAEATSATTAGTTDTERATEAVTEESTTEATTTEATTEVLTTEATTEATTEEATTEPAPAEHYWEYSHYDKSEDIVYYECCVAGCAETRSEKVQNLDVLLLETETGIRLVVHGGLYPSAELYCTFHDFRKEEVELIDTEWWLDGCDSYADIDLKEVSWLTVKAFDATARRILVVDYAVVDGLILT